MTSSSLENTSSENAVFPVETEIEAGTAVVDEDGTVRLPEGCELLYFTIQSTATFRSPASKPFPQLLPAIKNVIRRIEKKPKGILYELKVFYRTPEQGICCSVLFDINRNSRNSPVYLIFSSGSRRIPANWLPVKRKGYEEVQQELQTLKELYNVQHVTFRSSLSYKKQVSFLQSLSEEYKQLTKLVDVFHFLPVHVVTSKMKEWDAAYDEYSNNIEITEDDTTNLHHEYFHHMDSLTEAIRHKNDRVNDHYNSLADALLKTDSLQRVIYRYRDILDNTQRVKPKEMDTKRAKKYMYVTSYKEVLAYFFGDIFICLAWEEAKNNKKNYTPSVPRTKYFSFDETNKHKQDMLLLVNELAALYKNKE